MNNRIKYVQLGMLFILAFTSFAAAGEDDGWPTINGKQRKESLLATVARCTGFYAAVVEYLEEQNKKGAAISYSTKLATSDLIISNTQHLHDSLGLNPTLIRNISYVTTRIYVDEMLNPEASEYSVEILVKGQTDFEQSLKLCPKAIDHIIETANKKNE